MRHARCAALGLTLALLAPAAANAQPSFTIVARTGQPAPGAAGVSYGELGAPAINPAGQVAYFASLVGPTANAANNSAVFAGAPNAPALLARAGDSVGGGFSLARVDYALPRFNADGHALIGAPLAGPGIDPANDAATYAYYLAAPGSPLRKVAPAVGPNNSYFIPVLTAGDRAAWTGNDGPFTWSAANPTPASVGGAPIETVLLNPAGQLAFLSAAENGTAVIVGPPGAGQVVAQSDDPAPGTPAGTTFTLPLFPAVNAAGQVAFRAYLAPQDGPNSDASIWVGKPGAVGLVARAGNVAPGTGGLRYGDIGGDIDQYQTPALSPAGEVAFTTALVDGQQGFHGTALFAGKPGQVRLVAREGDHAPNAPVNYTVGDLRPFINMAINAKGQVAFLDNADTLYVVDADGRLTLIAAIGLPFQLAAGDSRIVTDVAFGELQTSTGGEDGRATGFNDLGQLVFTLGFADNTSAVVVGTVPEPSAMSILALTAALGARPPRRRNT
jgi:hypothetical protein